MELSGLRVLVTGGAGFVGSHLAERLVGDNEVVAVDDGSNGDPAWLPDAVELVEGDLTDPAVAEEAIT
ncbi:MAG: NAD-dependent epimerase/dehydratase family protein, partial [Actinobacteria bacterium]|nr:NAD-dependent epimerase/dehydratase family protein [Actinomycetota bacterium]NIU70528.1 NAD-dependent epimerase/dehydratase family protein [Actinomycetota bacterium]NIW32432.1 NAD-dependent epimerase/dehydratase family protein [Actinomycetota bacterium]NIX24636.1 NAD-dependent epimerase/dehydratase family protein [Actinomycetota bacterium]